jgi:hypothetical protein
MAGGYIAARPDIDVIDGRYWTPKEVVRLKIFNRLGGLLYQDSQTAGEYDPYDPEGTGTNVSFHLEENGFDLAIGQRVLMSSGGHTRELWIAPIAVTGYSFQGEPEPWISGTCNPAIFCWAHLDRVDPYQIDIDGGNWKAYFDYLIPREGGWAFQWDLDGDETRIGFTINTPDARMISAHPDEDYVEGVYWKIEIDNPVTLKVFDGNQDQIYEESVTPVPDETHAGGSYVYTDFQGTVDIQPGYTITMENNWIKRELVVSPIVVTGYSLEDASVFGTCDSTIFCWAHLDRIDPYRIDMDGVIWTAYFDQLNSGDWGWAFQWDLDGDETRIFFQID